MMTEKTRCTGCGVCRTICPQQAITLTADAEGFVYPHIDPERCIHCGKCGDCCPESRGTKAVKGMAFRNADAEVLKLSASGGAFPAIAAQFLTDHPDGTVFGAAYDKDLQVKHIGLSAGAAMGRFSNSKYVQSDLENTLAEIGDLLRAGKPVLFSGTPCQCAAVRKLFGNAAPLLLVDVVCNGVASPAAFRKYLHTISAAHGSRVLSYCFRDRHYEKRRGMSCTFADGTTAGSPHVKDLFCKLYLLNLLSRPSCYHCPFTTPNRSSDLTLGDFHGLEEHDPSFAENGVSLVIPHTEKGKACAAALPRMGKCREYPIEQCLQPRLKNPPKLPLLRRFILKDFLALPAETFKKKYGKMLER